MPKPTPYNLLILTLLLLSPQVGAEPATTAATAPPMAEGEMAPATAGPAVNAKGVAVNEGTLHNEFLLAEIRANAGEPHAQLELAHLYIEGKGTPKDEARANYWLDKAARAGLMEAQVELGDRYYAGTGASRPFYAHALKWYTAAAQQGDPHAMAMTGKMHYKGTGTERDYKLAFKWLYQSAQKRDAESQHLVGVMYRFGHGMDKNYLNSYIWLHVAYESTRDPAEKENILKQRDRVGQLMPENELLGAKLLAPEFADLYAWRE